MPATAGFNRFLPRVFGGVLDNRVPHGAGAGIGPWLPGDQIGHGTSFDPATQTPLTAGTVLASALRDDDSGLVELWSVSNPLVANGPRELRRVTWSVDSNVTDVVPVPLPALNFVDVPEGTARGFVAPDSNSEIRNFYWIGTQNERVRIIETVNAVEERGPGVFVPVEATRSIDISSGGASVQNLGDLVTSPFVGAPTTYLSVLADGWLGTDPAQLVLYFEVGDDPRQRLALLRWTGTGWVIAAERLFPDPLESVNWPYSSDLTFAPDSINGPPWQEITGQAAGTADGAPVTFALGARPGAALTSLRLPLSLAADEEPPLRYGDLVTMPGGTVQVAGVSAETATLVPGDQGWPARIPSGVPLAVTRARPVQSEGVGGGTLHLLPYHPRPVRLRPTSGSGWHLHLGPAVNPDLPSSRLRVQMARSVNGEVLSLTFPPFPDGPVDVTPTLLLTYRVRAAVILTMASAGLGFSIPFQLDPPGRAWGQVRVPIPLPRSPPGSDAVTLTLSVPDGTDLRLSSAVIDAAPTVPGAP